MVSALQSGQSRDRVARARTTYGQELPGAPTTSFYHADGNGNITALIYPDQQLAAKYLYDPFGNMLAMSGPLMNFNKYRFSSKEWDHNAGLYYYGYRFYDPSLQRWANRDPLGEGGFELLTYRARPHKPHTDQPISLSGFVGGNPVSWVDQLGDEYGNPISGPNGPVGPSGPYIPPVFPQPTNRPYTYGAVLSCLGPGFAGIPPAIITYTVTAPSNFGYGPIAESQFDKCVHSALGVYCTSGGNAAMAQANFDSCMNTALIKNGCMIYFPPYPQPFKDPISF